MVIFLHGDDTYRSREKLREIRERFLREVDPSGANLAVLDGPTAGASEIWGAIATQSFLVRKRMVIVENLGAAKSDAVREEVVGFLPKIPEDAVVVFWEGKSHAPSSSPRTTTSSSRAKRGTSPKRENSAPAKRAAIKNADPLFPILLREKYAQEFSPFTGAALERWVAAYAQARGAAFAPGACRELCAIVGGDLWCMAQEIEKLAIAGRALSLRGGEADEAIPANSSTLGLPRPRGRGLAMTSDTATITSQLIRSLVATTPTDNIFAFTDALGRGDTRAALAELQRLEATGAESGMLVGMIARQLRLLIVAADLLARGTPPAALAGKLGCHPFVARKIAEQARHHSLDRLRALFAQLGELDARLKSSRAPRQALVELFCLEATRAQDGVSSRSV